MPVVTRPTCLSFFERVGGVGASHTLSAKLASMEGKIEMAARRQVTSKLRDAYRKASKRDNARVLDEVPTSLRLKIALFLRLAI